MELQRADWLEKKLVRFKMRAISKAIKSGTLSQMPWTDLPFGLGRACSLKAEQRKSKTDVRFGSKADLAPHTKPQKILSRSKSVQEKLEHPWDARAMRRT
jgi:hypothetical protein